MPLSKFPFLPEQSSYSYAKPNDTVSITLDGGLSKSRRDIVGAPATVSCTWYLKLDEYQYFSAFYNIALNNGADSFLIDLILDQPEVLEYVAKFIPDSFEMTEPSGLQMIVSVRLEVLQNDTAAIDEMVLLFYGIDGYFESLEKLVNYDLAI